MTLFGTLALLCWLAFFASILWGLTIHYKIVEAVNTKRPGEEPLDMMNVRGSPAYKVWSLYRAYFPGGTLLRRYALVQTSAFVWFGLAAVFLVKAIR
jgi:hypothetical protein